MRILTFALALIAMSLQSATITFTLTNSVGQPDTNRIKLQPLQSYANADGSYQTAGFPFWIQPDTNGYVQTNLSQGNWIATNSFICSQYRGAGSVGTSQGVIFAVPFGSGTYSFVQVAVSGYNVFNYNGAALQSAYTNIVATLGFTPLTPLQTTNLAQSVTNGHTSIVFSNPSAFTTPSQVTNIILAIASTNSGISAQTATNIAQGAYNANPSNYITLGTLQATNTANLGITTNLVQNSTNGLLQAAIVASTSSLNAAMAVSTNSFDPTNSAQVVRTAMTLSNSATMSSVLSSSNFLSTNGLAQLVATNNSLVQQIAILNSNLQVTISTSSNYLMQVKQPASIVLSNLVATGAFTNPIAAGTNIALVTNIQGQVSFNTPSQTYLTNGLLLAAATISTNLSTVERSALNASNALAASTYYPLSNPSGFVTSGVTNQIATTNFVQQSLVASNYVTNLRATNIADAEIQTFAATGTVATARGLVSGAALTNTIIRALGGASTKAISVVDITGAEQFAAADDGVHFPNLINSDSELVGITDGILFKSGISVVSGIITSLGTAAYAPTNQFIASNDGRVIFALTNLAALTALSNQIAYIQSQVGCDTNFLLTTSAGVTSVNGTNVWSGSAWTNINGNSWWSNNAWYASGIASYGGAYPTTGTTNINGFNPQPVARFFPKTNVAGANITITRSYGVDTIASTGGSGGSATNVSTTNLVGFVGGVLTQGLTNLLFSAAGTNAILSIIPPAGGVTNATLQQYTTNTVINVNAYVTNTVADQIGLAAAKSLAATNALGGLAAFASTNRFLQSGPLGNLDGSLLSKVPGTTLSSGGDIGLANTLNANGTTNYALSLASNISLTIGTQILNTNLSADWTNRVRAVAAGASSNAIPLLNGTGTNTTLVNALNIGVTNLTVNGDTFLNDSRLHIYVPANGTGSALIPHMTSSNTPSGFASANSSFSAGTVAFYGFGDSGSGWYSARVAVGTNFIQYQFPSTVIVNMCSGAVGTQSAFVGSDKGYLNIQSSFDGITWSNILTTGIWTNNYTLNNVQILASGSYFRWNIYNPTSGIAAVASAMQLYNTNYVSTSTVDSLTNLLVILATNGIAINTNSANGYTVNINGNISATNAYFPTATIADFNSSTLSGSDISSYGNIDAQTYTANGSPISFLTNNITSLIASGGIGQAAALNGIYYPSGGGNWTNATSTNSAIQKSGPIWVMFSNTAAIFFKFGSSVIGYYRTNGVVGTNGGMTVAINTFTTGTFPISNLSTNGGNINQVPTVSASGAVVWTNAGSSTAGAVTTNNVIDISRTNTLAYLNAWNVNQNNGVAFPEAFSWSPTNATIGVSYDSIGGTYLWSNPKAAANGVKYGFNFPGGIGEIGSATNMDANNSYVDIWTSGNPTNQGYSHVGDGLVNAVNANVFGSGSGFNCAVVMTNGYGTPYVADRVSCAFLYCGVYPSVGESEWTGSGMIILNGGTVPYFHIGHSGGLHFTGGPAVGGNVPMIGFDLNNNIIKFGRGGYAGSVSNTLLPYILRLDEGGANVAFSGNGSSDFTTTNFNSWQMQVASGGYAIIGNQGISSTLYLDNPTVNICSPAQGKANAGYSSWSGITMGATGDGKSGYNRIRWSGGLSLAYTNGLNYLTAADADWIVGNNVSTTNYAATVVIATNLQVNGFATVKNIVISGNTNVAPANAVTPVIWMTVTNAGQSYRIPLYQ